MRLLRLCVRGKMEVIIPPLIPPTQQRTMMEGQCPCLHDRGKSGEVADVVSAQVMNVFPTALCPTLTESSRARNYLFLGAPSYDFPMLEVVPSTTKPMSPSPS